MFYLSIGLLLTVISLSWYGRRLRKSPACQKKNDRPAQNKMDSPDGRPRREAPSSSTAVLFDPEQVRKLYHCLHNLETNAGTLSVAKDVLTGSLKEADHFNPTTSVTDGIHIIGSYTPNALRIWLDNGDAMVMKEFEKYSTRRANGGSRELLPGREEATAWLRAQAPLRFVDGAWLGHISRVQMPWAHAGVVRQLWQILSEELGDGDIEKHHTRLFAQLLRSFAPDVPDAPSPDFLDRRHGATNEKIWRSAVLQSIVSLFQESFLPEILGFNLNFERISFEMLKAMIELRELKLDPTYFMLHVCIDNAASGHTAVALDAVCSYLAGIREQHGYDAEQQAWRKIQAGYALSDGRWHEKPPLDVKAFEHLQQSVAAIFESKAKAGSSAHLMCKGSIKGQRITDWLDLNHIGSSAWWARLVQSLGESRAWIVPGESERSRFVKELSWGGRMFGAFTEAECHEVRRWVAILPLRSSRPGTVRSVPIPDVDVATHHVAPYMRIDHALHTLETHRGRILATPADPSATEWIYDIDVSGLEHCQFLGAIWFSHFCLLEKFIALPSRCGDPLGALVLRVLRAQDGIGLNDHHTDQRYTATPTGPDEGLIFNLGHQILHFHGLQPAASLSDQISGQPCADLAETMFSVAAAPVQCRGMLLGMASAFISLHSAIAASSILDAHSRSKLYRVVDLEETELLSCLLMLADDQRHEFAKGFEFIRIQLSTLFKVEAGHESH